MHEVRVEIWKNCGRPIIDNDRDCVARFWKARNRLLDHHISITIRAAVFALFHSRTNERRAIVSTHAWPKRTSKLNCDRHNDDWIVWSLLAGWVEISRSSFEGMREMVTRDILSIIKRLDRRWSILTNYCACWNVTLSRRRNRSMKKTKLDRGLITSFCFSSRDLKSNAVDDWNFGLIWGRFNEY